MYKDSPPSPTAALRLQHPIVLQIKYSSLSPRLINISFMSKVGQIVNSPHKVLVSDITWTKKNVQGVVCNLSGMMQSLRGGIAVFDYSSNKKRGGLLLFERTRGLRHGKSQDHGCSDHYSLHMRERQRGGERETSSLGEMARNTLDFTLFFQPQHPTAIIMPSSSSLLLHLTLHHRHHYSLTSHILYYHDHHHHLYIEEEEDQEPPTPSATHPNKKRKESAPSATHHCQKEEEGLLMRKLTLVVF